MGSTQKKILLVEDDRSHRGLMDQILQSCGFQTVLAENGFVALSKIDQHKHFDLIMMDLDMPELDGLETTKAIRMREVKQGAPHMPVMAFTAHRNPGDKEKCLAAGMDAYLPKDVFLPKWQKTLVDNLQGLIAGDFNINDFDATLDKPEQPAGNTNWDIHEFDQGFFDQSALLLKNDLVVAVDEYLEDAVDYIRKIEKGLNAPDITEIARGSHPLKSNSKAFGLIAVANIAQAINSASENVEDEAQALQQVKALLKDLKEAFSIGEKKLKEKAKAHMKV